MSVPLIDQLKCVRRELALRKRVYPVWVGNGRLKKSQADEEIAAMAAVEATVHRALVLEEVSAEMLGRESTQPELLPSENKSPGADRGKTKNHT